MRLPSFLRTREPEPGKDETTMRRLTFVTLILFIVLSIFFVGFSFGKAFLFMFVEAPLFGPLFILFYALPYLLPAVLAAVLFKLKRYVPTLSIITLSLVIPIIAWQFAYQSKNIFNFYSGPIAVFFDRIGMTKTPSNILVLNEESLPPNADTSNGGDVTIYADRYFQRYSYPSWKIVTKMKPPLLSESRSDIEYSYYMNTRCENVRLIPHPSDKSMAGATSQTIPCRDGKSCTIVEPPKNPNYAKRIYAYMDDNVSCLYIMSSSYDENEFTTSTLLKAINAAERKK